MTAGDASRGGTRPPGPAGAPGLQRERTLLAWTRTLLALVVAALLLVRVLGAPLARSAHVPAVTVLVVALWLFLASDLRYRRGPRGGPVTSPLHVGALAAATVVVGVAATVALLAG